MPGFLIGVAGLIGSTNAVAAVGQLLHAGDRITLLVVTDKSTPELTSNGVEAQFLLTAATDILLAAKSPPANILQIVEAGEPADVLVSTARRCRSEILVVGAQNLGVVGRFLLGSTSLRCVRAADMDVLVVRKAMLPESAGGRVFMACWDGTEVAGRALECVLALAAAADSVLLLAVFEPREVTLGERFLTACDPTLAESVAEANAEQFAVMVKSAEIASGAPARRIELLCLTGHARTVICDVARERRVDVLALGGRSAGPPRKAVLDVACTEKRHARGSVTEHVLHHADAAAILVVKKLVGQCAGGSATMCRDLVSCD